MHRSIAARGKDTPVGSIGVGKTKQNKKLESCSSWAWTASARNNRTRQRKKTKIWNVAISVAYGNKMATQTATPIVLATRTKAASVSVLWRSNFPARVVSAGGAASWLELSIKSGNPLRPRDSGWKVRRNLFLLQAFNLKQSGSLLHYANVQTLVDTVVPSVLRQTGRVKRKTFFCAAFLALVCLTSSSVKPLRRQRRLVISCSELDTNRLGANVNDDITRRNGKFRASKDGDWAERLSASSWNLGIKSTQQESHHRCWWFLRRRRVRDELKIIPQNSIWYHYRKLFSAEITFKGFNSWTWWKKIINCVTWIFAKSHYSPLVNAICNIHNSSSTFKLSCETKSQQNG